MTGPVIAALLYTYIGYMECLLCFSVLLGAAGIMSYFILPSSLNKKLDTLNEEERAESVKLASKVPYKWFFTNRRSIFALITCSYVCLIFSFSESFFTPALKEEKGIDEAYHGFVVSI